MLVVAEMVHVMPPGWRPAVFGRASNDPRFVLIVGLFVLVAGFFVFRHREALGESTNYFIKGIPVTARTPGCIVVFAAVVAMLFGAFLVVVAAWQLLAG